MQIAGVKCKECLGFAPTPPGPIPPRGRPAGLPPLSSPRRQSGCQPGRAGSRVTGRSKPCEHGLRRGSGAFGAADRPERRRRGPALARRLCLCRDQNGDGRVSDRDYALAWPQRPSPSTPTPRPSNPAQPRRPSAPRGCPPSAGPHP